MPVKWYNLHTCSPAELMLLRSSSVFSGVEGSAKQQGQGHLIVRKVLGFPIGLCYSLPYGIRPLGRNLPGYHSRRA